MLSYMEEQFVPKENECKDCEKIKKILSGESFNLSKETYEMFPTIQKVIIVLNTMQEYIEVDRLNIPEERQSSYQRRAMKELDIKINLINQIRNILIEAWDTRSEIYSGWTFADLEDICKTLEVEPTPSFLCRLRDYIESNMNMDEGLNKERLMFMTEKFIFKNAISI